MAKSCLGEKVFLWGGTKHCGTGVELEPLRTVRLVFCEVCKIRGNFHFHKLLTPIPPCSLMLSKLAEPTRQNVEAQGRERN